MKRKNIKYYATASYNENSLAQQREYVVYGLYCPVTDVLKYIGVTKDLKARYKKHINRHETNDKAKWILKLLDAKQYPRIRIFAEYDDKHIALRHEKELIQELTGRGLTNKTHSIHPPMTDEQKHLVEINVFQMMR